MQKLKRPVSIILSILMVVSMFVAVPVTASAADYVAEVNGTQYETLAAAIAAAQDDDIVKLIANVTETVTVSGKTLTLDLNGFNITSASSSKMAVNANNGAKLTINNSNTAKSENTPTQNAILGGTSTNNRGSLSASGAGTTVDICAGYYYGYNGNKTAIHAINGATITFYDCVVNGAQGIDDSTTGKEGKVFYSGVNNPKKPNDETPGYIVVHGGVFNGRMSDSNWGNYLIDGGTFDRNSVVLNENPVDENGDRVATSSGSMTQLAISPGTLYESGWLAPGYAPVANANSTFTVNGPYAAMIGETGYATLAAAIAAAQAGDTVKLVANVTEAVSITGKTLTLDLNGFNITSPSSTQPIKAYDGTKLTITNSNRAKAENTPTQNAVLGSTGGANNYGSLFASGDGTEVIINAGYYYGYNGDKTAIHAVNKATVTFNDCVVNGAAGFDGTGTTGKEGKIFYSGVGNPTQPYAMDPGYIVVHGGTFSGRMSDSNWGNYLIDGGTFDRNAVVINENPVDANGNRVATESGNMAKIKDGTFYDSNWLAPGFAPVANGDGTFTVDGPYAARIGNTPYATFAEAVAARANNDVVITLLKNYDGTYTMAPGKLVVDKNGFTFAKPTVQGAYLVGSANEGDVYTYTTTEAAIEFTSTSGAVSYQSNIDYSNMGSSGTYKLLKDITAGSRIVPGNFVSSVTVDLNGHTLTSNATDQAFRFSRAGSKTFVITDTSTNGGGKIVANNLANTGTSNTASVISISGNNNNVTISNITIETTQGIGLIGTNQSLTIDNCDITVTGTDYALSTNGSLTNGAAITVTDSSIESTNGIAVYLPGGATSTFTDTDVTGTTAMYIKSGTTTISGGTYTATGDAAEFTHNGNGANATGDAIVVESCNYPNGVPTVSIGADDVVTAHGKQIGDYTYGENVPFGDVTATSNTLTLPEDLKWVETETEGVYEVAPKVYVAQVGTTKYETLQAALDVVPTGGTVTVLQNITTSGNIFCDGYVSGGNRTYTVDLGGYTVSGGTFIVADGNTVTFTNGTIESASYGIQNTATAIVDETATVKSTATNASAVYGAAGSDTTINGTVEGDKYGVIVRGGTLNVAGTVTASDTNGTAIDAIDGGIANINNGADVSSYFAVVAHKNSTVNVKDGAEITGVSHALSGNGQAADGPYTMNVTGGTLTATNGAAIYNPNAQGTLNISGGTITGNEKAVVSGEQATTAISGGTFNTPVPKDYCAEGYTPKDNGDGTYTVTKKLFVGHTITLGGNIGVNFFINSTAADFKNATKATVKFTWDNNEYSEEVNLKTMTPESGIYKASVEVVAAHMAHKIHAVVYINGEALAETDDYSVQDYAEAVYKDNNQPEKLRALAKAMLNYGAEAQTVFASALKTHPDRADINVGGAADYSGVTAALVQSKINGTASDLNAVATDLNAKYYTNSLIYLQNNTLRIYFTPQTYPANMPHAGAYDDNLSNYYYYKDVEGIAAADLDDQQEFNIAGVDFTYSPLNYVVNVLNSGMGPDQKNLAKALFLYNQAANAYFD